MKNENGIEEIYPMEDKTANFRLCFTSIKNPTPTCILHGSMICVGNKNGKKVWRCLRSISTKHCHAGCTTLDIEEWRRYIDISEAYTKGLNERDEKNGI